jgi:hypothetical protein
MTHTFSAERLSAEERTFSEVREILGDKGTYKLFQSGKIDAEIDNESRSIQIDGSSKASPSEFDPDYKFREREGLWKAMIPLDLALDIPYGVGRKSAKFNKGEKEATAESLLGSLSGAVSAPAAIYDLASKYGEEVGLNLAELSQTQSNLVLAGFTSYFILNGRSDAIKEKVAEEYLDQIEGEAGDYVLEAF